VIVTVNGRPHELDAGASVARAVELTGSLAPSGIAVAVDGEVVPRALWEQTRLSEGQAVEVVAAVQGG
jgi:sulfur carrier protein